MAQDQLGWKFASMNLGRYFNENQIKLEMETAIEPLGEDESPHRRQQATKEAVLIELVDLIESAYRIGNRKKLVLDYVNREKKASTAIGRGVAIPHIRSMQAKEFMICFARSTTGYYFDAPDNEPVRLFFIMAAPPYDDNFYLRVFKELAGMVHSDEFREELLTVKSAGEVIRAIKAME